MRVEDLRPIGLFDGLTDDQLGQLVAAGTEARVEPGVEAFHEGDRADHWWVLVDGALDLRRHIGREETLVGRMDVPGRWAGGFRAWDEDGVYLATGVGASEARLLKVPAPALRELMVGWFPLGVHLISGLYRTARSIESTARQRESLVTLGRLAAGLAHEINNPAAAATRAVDALEVAAARLQTALDRLAGGGVTADRLDRLHAIGAELGTVSPAADALELADREDALSSWLKRAGIDDSWLMARPLAAAGVDVEWCRRAAELLPSGALAPGLEWVANAHLVTRLVGEVKESTGRVSDLVGAVRSYSQMDRGSRQLIDVTDGLESTLTMLGHKLHDVTVVRDYARTPRIEAYAGALNQVWTNLVDNAVDAMSGSGTLRVSTRAEDPWLVVEIGDTGPGIPAEVAERAFEAFYTTKGVGQGTGLGLDIARRIVVEEHRGAIEIDSRPGETVLRVRLPVGPTAEAADS